MHKTKRAKRSTYKTARHDTAQFILTVIEYMWVQELWNPEIFYTDVAPNALLAHLKEGFTDRHALDLLAQHNDMKSYHLEVEGITEYINLFEDAQKQVGKSGQTTADKTLLLFASTAILTTERYPRANDYWEDRAEDTKPGITGRPDIKRRTIRRASKHK